MLRHGMVAELASLGFTSQETASTRWQNALFSFNGTQTLIVLVRVNGVDILLTPRKVKDMLNAEGSLSISMRREGDKLALYHCTDGGLDIYSRAVEVASLFAKNQVIADSYFEQVGLGKTERDKRNNSLGKSRGKIRILEIYDVISLGRVGPTQISL